MGSVLLILYVFSSIAVGWVVLRRWSANFPLVLLIVGSFLVGTTVAVPVTYFFAILLSKTAEPMLWGTLASTILFTISYFVSARSLLTKRILLKVSINDAGVVVFSLVFSSWLMFKTFHGDANGQLFVGSNNVFDFGHALGITRSFSWGSNIPMMSPFESGAPFFYHFFFYFWVALREYFGVPIVWAMNIPSILSFTSLLIVIYFLPQLLLKQKPLVGWVAVFLTITNSSLTFWHLLWQKGISLQFFKDMWRLPAYPFAGPFDGSTISIYMTLNNYVNQRHLAFSVATGLFIFLLASKNVLTRKESLARNVILGVLTGLIFLWNIAVFLMVMILIALLYVRSKQWKPLRSFLGATFITAILINLPNVTNFYTTFVYFGKQVALSSGTVAGRIPTWNIVDYLWQNLGLLPLAAGLGFVLLPKKIRMFMYPFVFLFFVESFVAGLGKRGFDQKYLSFLVIGINTLAATGLVWLWQRRKLLPKGVALIMLASLTISGVITLLPIKNEFAFPLVERRLIPIISWVRAQTPKDSIFVSYADMIDPVVFAGRKNYFGFFGNIGWKYRIDSVQRIYSGDTKFAVSEDVNYILIPKWDKSDFPYSVDVGALTSAFPVAYTDTDFLILKVR